MKKINQVVGFSCGIKIEAALKVKEKQEQRVYLSLTVGAFVGAPRDGSKLRTPEFEKQAERILAQRANVTDHSQLVQAVGSILDISLVQVKLD